MEIDPKDLKIDIYRNSELVNVGAHAVRITHVPTGTVVTSDEPNLPSWKNRDRAMELLKQALQR